MTVEAIFEATVQVLLRDGARLTTTRVAERAGVSVGTMYQYFPHKQALIHALVTRQLGLLAERIDALSDRLDGAPSPERIEAFITLCWQAKTERPGMTRALHLATVELDNRSLVAGFTARVEATVARLLAAAPDLRPLRADELASTLVIVILGTLRGAFERDLDAREHDRLRAQLVAMCQAWLRSCAPAD